MTDEETMGAMRWLAPELLHDDKTAYLKTPAADAFSYGRICLAVCLCFSLYVGHS
jgi:hypothetical protein